MPWGMEGRLYQAPTRVNPLEQIAVLYGKIVAHRSPAPPEGAGLPSGAGTVENPIRLAGVTVGGISPLTIAVGIALVLVAMAFASSK